MAEGKEKLTVTIEKPLLDQIEGEKNRKNLSRSEIVRRALDFYFQYENLRSIENDKMNEYIDLLVDEDHIILDIDRWIAFLEQIDIDNEEFREKNKRITKSHKSEFSQKIQTLEDLLKRLEKCNLFKLKKTSDDIYTLSTDSSAVDFIEQAINDYAEALGFDIETEKSVSKIRIRT